jgi:divalent metal cation (Fe/Co/Zn/Cd) transporter
VTRDLALRRALLLSFLSIVLNGLFGVAAIAAGVTGGSLSLLGFGFDAAIDALASVVLIWRFRIEAKQPARATRVEHLAERTVGAALIVIAISIALGAVRALIVDAHPGPSDVGTAIALASVVALPPLALAKWRVAGHLGSGALRADSLLTGIAALLALVSLAGLVLSAQFGLTWADAVGGLVASVILAREGVVALQASAADPPSA